MQGRHLIMDLYSCAYMGTMNEVYNLLNELVELVEMKKLTSPYVIAGADHDPGVTGFVIIETSHIAIHTFDNRGNVAFDLYSCKDFDSKPVIDKLQKLFKPERSNIHEQVRII